MAKVYLTSEGIKKGKKSNSVKPNSRPVWTFFAKQHTKSKRVEKRERGDLLVGPFCRHHSPSPAVETLARRFRKKKEEEEEEATCWRKRKEIETTSKNN